MIKKILHFRFLLIAFKLNFLHLIFIYDISFKNPSFFSYYEIIKKLDFKIKKSSAHFCNIFVLISFQKSFFFGKIIIKRGIHFTFRQA